MIVQRSYPGAVINGADGCVETALTIADNCCPPSLCKIDPCGMFCSFINLLPEGPMWDYWKRKAIDYYAPPNCDAIGFETADCRPALECPSLVQHAIYKVFMLFDLISNALWPVLRESNPATAETTVDSWLERLGWEDCYDQNCRSAVPGQLSPFEIMGECGITKCSTIPIDADVQCALNRAILLSITRLQMGIVRNLCSINWVIAPLGAEIVPYVVAGIEPPCFVRLGECETVGCTPDYKAALAWQIRPTSNLIEACTTTNSPCGNDFPRGTVSVLVDIAAREDECSDGGITPGLPLQTHLGVLAAECIVRSLLPRNCPNKIYRGCIVEPVLPTALLLSGDQEPDAELTSIGGNEADPILLSGDF